MAEGEGGPERLTESVVGSDVVFDLYCDICHEENKQLEAEGFCVNCQDYLCGSCFKGHKSSRICRNHVLQDKSQMPRQKLSQEVPSVNETCLDKCDRHRGRLIEYYCRDDKSLGCSVCMTMDHRVCNGVDHIPALAETLLDSQQYKQFIQTLHRLKAKSQGVIKKSKKNASKAEECFSDVAKFLQSLRNQMNEAFDKLEGSIKISAEKIRSTDIRKLEELANKGNAVLAEVEKISAELQDLERGNQLGQIFIEMLKLENTVETLSKRLSEASADNKVTTYMFERGSQIQELLNNPSSIGKISVKDLQDATSSPADTKPSAQTPNGQSSTTKATAAEAVQDTDPKDMKAKFVNDINVKTDSDTSVCRISGSAMLPGDKMVLIDSENNKIKLLNLKTSNVVSELKTSASPWDIASISETHVVATVPQKRKLVVVKVTGSLVIERKVRVDGECTAVVHNKGKIILAFAEPRKIDVIALDGTAKRKIEYSQSFRWTSHMALRPNFETIYVSDRDGYCVKRFSLRGAVQAVYRDGQLDRPRGLAVLKSGAVLVCGGASNNIHLLTSGLTKVKVLVDRLPKPQSLSYCHSTEKIFVGMYSNNVKVYQLS